MKMKGGKKKMKRRVMGILLVAITIFGININKAYAESYYTNSNGVEFTQEEYDFLTTFYWDSYVENMTEEQYEVFINSDLLSRELTTASTTETMCSPQSTSHTTSYKNLKISAACSSDCVVSLVLTWLGNPTVRSYDVIGTYLSNVSLLSAAQATVSNTTTTYYYSNTKTAYNGFGNSVLLPSGSNLIVNQIITTTTGGHVYGSYQHATQAVTLPVSKDYNFSLAGYGSVFSFYGNAVGIYDGMAGVDIAV